MKGKKIKSKRVVKNCGVALALSLMTVSVGCCTYQTEAATVLPGSVTISSPMSLSSIALPASSFGTLSWANPSVIASQYAGSYPVILHVTNTQGTDFSQVPGWDPASGTVSGSVTVIVQSLAPAPKATLTPKPTQTPAATPAPEETKAPEATSAPEETKAPEATPAPEETKAPEATSAPEEMKAPGETSAPEETEAPGETEDGADKQDAAETPEETGTPGETADDTDAKDAQGSPEETGTPGEMKDDTDTKDTAGSPEETEAPDMTDTPEESESTGKSPDSDAAENTAPEESAAPQEDGGMQDDASDPTEGAAKIPEIAGILPTNLAGSEELVGLATAPEEDSGETEEEQGEFSVSSELQYAIAGSSPLVGGEIADNSYGDITVTSTPVPSATAAPYSDNTDSSYEENDSYGGQDTSYAADASDTPADSSYGSSDTETRRFGVQTGDVTELFPYITATLSAALIAFVTLFTMRSRKRRRMADEDEER